MDRMARMKAAVAAAAKRGEVNLQEHTPRHRLMAMGLNLDDEATEPHPMLVGVYTDAQRASMGEDVGAMWWESQS